MTPNLEATLPVRLVLWDVDHTLLELGRLHYDLYARALPAAFGVQPDRLPDMTGRTDRDSSTEYLTAYGIDATDKNLARFWRALVEELNAVRDDIAGRGHTTGGACGALSVLAEVPGVYQSVLTGNLRPLAEGKLRAFGLDRFLDFDIGGYGEDSTVRGELVSTAVARFTAKHGVTVDRAHTVLVGDTPLDVHAALFSGSGVIGVATGESTIDDLRRAGAGAVLANLEDAEAVRQAVELVTS